MESKVLASEIIAEQESKLEKVLFELNNMDSDFDKIFFIIEELLDLVDLKEPETINDALLLHENQMRIDLFIGILSDYVHGVQKTISDIIVRGRKEKQ